MDAVEMVRAAADRTVAAGTARLTMTSPSPAASSTEIEGTIDFATRRSWARVAMPSMGDDTVVIEMIIDGPDLYLELLGHPGRFVRTRLDEHSDGMPAGDPGLLLDWLRGCTSATPAPDTMTETGDGDAPLTVLDVVIDLDRAVEAAPEATRRAVRLWMDQIAPDGRPRPARVALDHEGRVHQLTVHEVGGELEVRLTDHARPLEVAIPDDTAVVDPDELHQFLPDLPDLPPPPADWNGD